MTVRALVAAAAAFFVAVAVAGAAGSFDVRKVSETATTITLGWDAQPGADGYRFYKDGVAVSRTFDPSRTTVKFSKDAQTYGVTVLRVSEGDAGTYPPPAVPTGCAVTTPNVPDGPDGRGGCFPGPTNTGPNGTLTAHTGSCSLASGNYDSRTFNCDVTVSGPVSITNSQVNGSIQVTRTGNLTITDTYVDASPNGPRETRAIWNDEGGSATIVRNELVGGNGTVWCDNCTVRDSYIHGQEIRDPWHASAVRADQNATIVHNSLWCEAQPIGREGGCSADLTGYPDFQPTHHWQVERNLFMANNTGIGFCSYGGATGGKPYSGNAQNATYIVFRDNVFQRGPNGKCGSYGPITDFAAGRPGNVWSGNVWDDGGTVQPG